MAQSYRDLVCSASGFIWQQAGWLSAFAHALMDHSPHAAQTLMRQADTWTEEAASLDAARLAMDRRELKT